MNVNSIEKPLKQIALFFHETPLPIAVTAVGGIAALYLAPQLAPSLLGFTSAILTTRLVIKFLDWYNISTRERIKKEVFSFDNKFGKIHYIALIIAIAVIPIFPLLSLVLAIVVGCYKGMVIEMQASKIKQKMDRCQSPVINYSNPVFES